MSELKAFGRNVRPTKMSLDSGSLKGTIGILTGGGDVPGLNPAIRAVTIRAIQEGYKVIGIRRGWSGLINIDRSKPITEQDYCQVLDRLAVNSITIVGGTFLHTSRTNPLSVKKSSVPPHLIEKYDQPVNDLTPEVMLNLEYLGINCIIPIGGDDTLSYAAHLHTQGFKVVAIPKTMDNDVNGTDYCIGFSTAVTRTVGYVNLLKTCASSHERFLVAEVFGRYAGFTALIPAMTGVVDRCIIPEHEFDINRLTELLCNDRRNNPHHYSVVLVSEGAMFEKSDMVYENNEPDAFGHKKLGGIGDQISQKLKELSPEYNNGVHVEVVKQHLGYLVRSGEPDATDSMVCMAFGNLAMNLVAKCDWGKMVVIKNGKYGNIPLDVVVSAKKRVDVEKFYNTERYRPIYLDFEDHPMWILK